MRILLRSRFVVLLAIMLMVVVAACGETDDGDTPAADAGDDAETETETGTEAEAEPGATEDAGGEGGDDAASDVSSEGFYAGETVEIIVPVSAGGGTDAQGRLVASMMTEFVDGNPTAQVVNLVGGGGILAGNQFAQQRDPNGLHLIMMGPSTLLPWILGDSAVEYDIADMVPLWAGPMPHVGYLRPDIGVESVEDLQNPDEQLVFGATSPTGADLPMILGLEALELLDDMQVVFGYEGGSAKAQAFQAGELNMDRRPSGTYMRSNIDAYEAGEEIIVFTLGMPDGQGGLQRDLLFPDAPHLGEAYEILHGTEPEGEAWEAFKLLYVDVLVNGGYSFWTHKDAPPEAIDALQEGLQRMIDDPGYQEQTTALIGPYDQISGSEVREWGESLEDMNEDTIQWIRDFVRDEYGVSFD